MTTNVRRVSLSRLAGAAVLGTLAFAANGCERMPLLAPSGTAITILASANAPAAGQTTITAILIEGGTTSTGGNNNASTSSSSAGTPVHNGTVVSFYSSIGTITPAEAKTTNGRVSVSLVGDGRIGDCTITVTSGPAIKTLVVKFE